MCLNPKLIPNKRFLPNKKNGGFPPYCDDKRKLYVPIGCGLCIECRQKRAREWRTRIVEELKQNPDALFVTLNLSDQRIDEIESKIIKQQKKQIKALHKARLKEGIKMKKEKPLKPDANDVTTFAMRKFLENIRKKTGKSLKHFFITELGQESTERIHLHGIIWDTSNLEMIKVTKGGKRHWESKLMNQKWKGGKVWIGDYCNARTANYIIKYITKTDKKHPEFFSKVLPSPGIGKRYVESYDAKKHAFNGTDTNELYRLNNGFKTALPMYYRHKLFTDEERDNLWTILLDKQKRYVMGHEIDVSTPEGMKEYENVREYYRAIDIRNGNVSEPYKLKKERTKYSARIRYLSNVTKEMKAEQLKTPNRRSFEKVKSGMVAGCLF